VQTSNNEPHAKLRYAQIMSFYRERILNGILPAGTQLPTEMEIAQEHQISRGTVRQALTLLATEGLLERVQGKGTFVRLTPALHEELLELSHEKSIGLILSGSTDDELSMGILRGAEQIIKARGYQLNVAFVNNDTAQLSSTIGRLRKHTAGLIIFPSSDTPCIEAIEQLKQEEIPYVLTDRYLADIESDYIGVTNLESGYRATEHLIVLGHIRIGFAYSDADGLATTSVQDRWNGYRKALQAYNLPYDDDTMLLRDAPPSTAPSPNAYDEYMQRTDRPDAIFAVNDFIALGILQAAQRSHIAIPEQLALVGFDDVSYATHIHPALTTIVQPRKEIGIQAANLLIDRIEGKIVGPPRHIELPTQLIVRESCGTRLKVKNHIRSSQ
jgi:GntR family transcriptional regulator, arabinose operon transcriptional repressor